MSGGYNDAHRKGVIDTLIIEVLLAAVLAGLALAVFTLLGIYP